MNTRNSHIGGFLRKSPKPVTSQDQPFRAGTTRISRPGARPFAWVDSVGRPGSSDKGQRAGTPRLEDAAKMLRVVRVGELAGARQVEVVQTRQPESERRRAQQHRPGLLLVAGELADAAVRGQERLSALRVDLSRWIDAPVVHGNRDVEQERVDAGEIEVDHPADAFSVEQDVVAKQIGMNGAARQVQTAVLPLEIELRGEQLAMRRVEERRDLPRRLAPPSGSPRILEPAAVALSGEVHVAEDGADPLAMAGSGGSDRRARQAGDDGRGLAVQGPQVLVAAIGDRRGTGDAMAREMRHEVQVEGELRRAQPLEQGQDEAAVRRPDE